MCSLDNIRIILVGITHPGNIGAAARAMKTMGLSNLVLVNPKVFPCAEATARAAGADDILARAKVYHTFEDSLQDCHLVFGTSTRSRSISWPTLTPRTCAEKALIVQATVAIVFGREHSGLTNRELDCCHYLVSIPTNPIFSSLNVAAAVQVLAYEIFTQQLTMMSHLPAIMDEKNSPKVGEQPASAEAMTQFYRHFEQTLTDVGFLNPQKPRRLMRRLRRLFNRAQPNESEINILRGILTAVQIRRKAL